MLQFVCCSVSIIISCFCNATSKTLTAKWIMPRLAHTDTKICGSIVKLLCACRKNSYSYKGADSEVTKVDDGLAVFSLGFLIKIYSQKQQ